MVNINQTDIITTETKSILVVETPRRYSKCRLFVACMEEIFDGYC